MWLSNQNVTTVVDFTKQCNFKYQLSNDKEYVSERIGEVIKCFKKQEEAYGHVKYKPIDYCPRIEWIGMIGEIKRNGELIVNSIVRYVNQERLNQHPLPFN